MGLKEIKISQFLTKLYDLINNEKYNNDIIWNKDGTSFIIKNYQNFCYNIMPKIFGLHLFSSFHHQLNCYGFIKINTHEYYNKYFTKNDRSLLINIKRRRKKNKLKDSNNNNMFYSLKTIKNKINDINNKRNRLEKKLYLIQKKQEYLINENNFLRNKLFEAQTKQQDLGYIFFSMVENLYPEFSLIKKQCLYFINSNSVLPNIENQELQNYNINSHNLKEYNNINKINKIDSGISLCNTQDTKTQEEYDNYIDVE
jgi:hypothetical protein